MTQLTGREYIENFRRILADATEGFQPASGPLSAEQALQGPPSPYQSSQDSYQASLDLMRLTGSTSTVPRPVRLGGEGIGSRGYSLHLSEGIRTYTGGSLGTRESRVPPVLGLARSVGGASHEDSPRPEPRRTRSDSLRLGGRRHRSARDAGRSTQGFAATDADLERLMQEAIDGTHQGPRVIPQHQPGLELQYTIRPGEGVTHELEERDPLFPRADWF